MKVQWYQMRKPPYFKVVTWSTKTDRIFDTWDQAYDYIIMNDDESVWYIEKVPSQLTEEELAVYNESMRELAKCRSEALEAARKLYTPPSGPELS